MTKTKDVLIFIFAFGVIFAIGFSFYTLFDIQKQYAGEPTESETILTSSRYLCGFSNDSLKVRTEFLVVKTIKDSIIRYSYKSKTDSTRNFEINYRINSQKLFFDETEYKKFDENVLQNNYSPKVWFDKYEMSEPIIDGLSPIMFNDDYGILAITGPLGPTYLFLTKKSDTLFSRKILDKLN